MCGKFRQTRSEKLLQRQFDAELNEALADFDILLRFNIAPTQPVVAIKQERGKPRRLTIMRWGLIPSWAKDASIGNRRVAHTTRFSLCGI
jgi:putative SOS response-associated peptidase YedK